MRHNREGVNLTHQVHMCGKLGRLQTLSVIPVLPGDSLELELDGIARLAPQRKEVVSETQIDVCAFYIPYRHCYPNWGEYILSNVMPALPTIAVPSTATDLQYIMNPYSAATVPQHMVQMYNQIWDRYFRVPSLPKDSSDLVTFFSSSADDKNTRLYGRRCSRLLHPTNDGIRTDGTAQNQPWRDLTQDDWTYEASVTGAIADIDLQALEQVKGEYGAEVDRVWFTDRYSEILQRRWGTTVNIDADQRPELCYRETMLMSGHDVDGADDATLGQYAGKTVSRVGMRMPRKFFKEHGMVWVMALVRHPFVHVGERHKFFQEAMSLDPQLAMADPRVMENTAPVQFSTRTWLADDFGSNPLSATDVRPFGQEYRMHCNNVHQHFSELPGYPFLKDALTDLDNASYYQLGEYDDIFQTSQLAHWQMHAKVNALALRQIPAAVTSVYAGV